MAHIHLTETPRCIGCGQWVALSAMPESRVHYEPLSEFGLEVIEITCPKCVEAKLA